MSLEDRLRRAFRRVEPGEDFAERVMAKLDAQARSGGINRRWAIAAGLVLALAIGFTAARGAWVARTQRLEAQRFEARNEAARQQLAWALDLTSRELEHVHRHLNRNTEESGS